jgi:hypothetical protein
MPGRTGQLLALFLVLSGAASAEETVLPLPRHTAAAASVLLPGRGDPGNLPAIETDPVETMPVLLETIAAWLAAEFGLPPLHEAPAVKFVPARAMMAVRLRDMPPTSQGAGLVAIYDDAKRTIHLPQGWTGRSPAELSVLVHEMVHHLQNAPGVRFECAEAREKMAYEAQARWLAAFGSGLDVEFGIDPLTLLVRTSCFR